MKGDIEMFMWFKVRSYGYELGRPDVLYSWFSTICVRLEDGVWGSRYPLVMNSLFYGMLDTAHIDEALREVESIKAELKRFSCRDIVWDIDDLSLKSKAFSDIDPDSCLSDFYVNADGDTYVDLLIAALEWSKEIDEDVTIAILGFPELCWVDEYKSKKAEYLGTDSDIDSSINSDHVVSSGSSRAPSGFSPKVGLEIDTTGGVEYDDAYYDAHVDDESLCGLYELCETNFLVCFFSTICVRLENGVWGSKYPYVMNELYQGLLPKEHVVGVIDEFKDIADRLKGFSPDKVVWDYENQSLLPPWGNDISDDVTNLYNYFITSDGEYMFEVFEEVLHRASELNVDVKIVKM